MVKHTQTNRRQIADDLFECLWPFCGIGAKRVNIPNIPDEIKGFDSDSHFELLIVKEITYYYFFLLHLPPMTQNVLPSAKVKNEISNHFRLSFFLVSQVFVIHGYLHSELILWLTCRRLCQLKRYKIKAFK